MRIIFLFLTTFILVSCNISKDRTEDLKLIDKNINEINEIEKVFKSIDIVTTRTEAKTIMDDIKYVQKNYKDTMPKEDAMFLTNYKNVAKLVKKLDKTEEKINLEIIRTRTQLTNLKSAITSKATEDKTGNVIDDNYLDKAIKEEQLYVKQLVDQINTLNQSCTAVMKDYPEMKTKADSIITALQLKMSANV